MPVEHAVNEWRLRANAEPDVSAVEISLLCLVDHEDKERQKYHTFCCKPATMLQTMEHWKHKYPEQLGWRNHQFLPTMRHVPKHLDDRLYDFAGKAPWWLEKLGYRHNTNFTLTQRASSAITNAIESLATSSTLLVGYESATYDNSSNDDVEVYLSGVTTVGTTPTINTRIEHNIVTEIADGTWPDVFDGTTGAETVTSQGIKDTVCKRVATLNVDATTTDRPYPYIKRSVAALFSGFAPSKFVVFTTHNTGVNLNSTGGNHVLTAIGAYLTGT